jgi:TonB-linked SusC/RagA family outer membrane protein
MKKKFFSFLFDIVSWCQSSKAFRIMRLTIFLLILSLSNLMAEPSYAQLTELTLELKSATVEDVLLEIEKTSGFYFLYNNKLIDVTRVVNVSYKNEKIANILENLFPDGDVEFTIKDKQIILSSKNYDKLYSYGGLVQQNQTIKGRITDETGMPVIGVNIVEKGTVNGTISDAGGNYSITISAPEAVLEISFVGYLKQEVTVSANTTVNITLKEDITALDEVVVVGYGTVKKSDVTGALASVGTKEIQQQMNMQNPLQVMQGRVAGVDITTNNRPGEIGTIRVRGERSLAAGNEPLYVVDGIPLAVSTYRLNTDPQSIAGRLVYEDFAYNPIADLNPNDIESIEILKDASATAIYGSRGANGVILITTKKGQPGKAKISYEGSLTFDKMDDRVKMFDAAGQFEMMREAWRHPQSKKYSTPYPNPEDDYKIIGAKDPFSWESIAMGYEWEDKENMIPKMRTTTAEEKALWGADEVPVYNPENVRNTDWMSMAVQTGITQNHQVGASAGTDKLKAYCSFGYLDQKGIQKAQSYERFNALVSVDMQLNKWLRFGGLLNGVFGEQQYGPNTYDMARGMLPFAVPYDTADNFIWLPGGETTIVNFIKDIDNVINDRKSIHIRGSFYAEIDLFKGLKYRVNFGPDYRQYRNGTFLGSETTNNFGGPSSARYYQNQAFNWTLENLLYYNANIADIHNIGITLLLSAEDSRSEYSHLSAENLPYDEQLWYDLGSARTGVAKDYGSNFRSIQRQSYMARLNYSLLNRYLFTFSGRWDGASVLSPENRWHFFPSAALAWKIQEESFLKQINQISEAKIRLGWGITGNPGNEPYMAAGQLKNWNYNFGSTPAIGWAIQYPPNQDLRWESTSQLNIGLDFGLFNNRVRGSVDWYTANTYDLLLWKNIPVVNGADKVLFNIGKTNNKGIELLISTVNISKNDLRWRTDFTFSRNKNKIVELYDAKNDDIANLWFIGEPIKVNYGYLYDGIWQGTPEDSAKRVAYGSLYRYPGTIRVKDIDTTGGANKINAYDMTVRGTEYPDFIAGMTNYITYKGFELSFFIYARVGQTIGKAVPGLYGRYHDIDVEYWTPTNTNAEYPRPNFATGITDPFMSTMAYQKGSFVKVKNISLSYSLPASLLSKVSISNLAIKVQLLNPILITKAVNTDPDAGNNATKSFVIGINAGF